MKRTLRFSLAVNFRSMLVSILGQAFVRFTAENHFVNNSRVVSSKPRLAVIKTLGLAFLLGLMGTTSQAQVVLGGWDMSTLPGGANNFGPSPYNPTTTFAEVTVGGIVRGAGVSTSGSGAARGWGGTSWQLLGTPSDAIVANKFFTYTIKSNACYKLNLSSINPFDYRRSGSGPDKLLVQYQLNAGAFVDIVTLNAPSTSSSGASFPATDLTGISALQGLPSSTTVTFRFVPYNATNVGGTFYIFDTANSTANDFAINGTTTSFATIAVTETSGTTNNDGIICAGDPATLTASSGTGYAWSTMETMAAIVVSPTMTTTYTVTVTDGSGCTNTASTTITVTPAATVNAGPDQTTCVNTNGLQGIVQVLATIGGSATGGSWSDGGAGGTFSSPTTLATYYTAPLNNVAPITLTFTTTGPCAAVSDQLVITYAALPHLTLTAIAPTSGTCGDIVTFIIEATNGFTDIGSLQYSVNWNPAQLMYVSSVATVIGGGAPGIGDFAAYVNNGQLTYAWFDPAGSDGEDLANNSVLLSITMKILTNSGAANLSITGTPTPIEATNAQFCTLMVDVNQATLTVSPIAVTCPGNQAVCLNAPAFALTGGMPAGGTYSGPGVSGGIFTPATAGAGMHIITYTYTNNATMCTNSCTFVITVNALPVVTCPADFTTCISTAPFPLGGGAPAGGDYDGDGVSGNVFSPMDAGLGAHDISYTYTDGNGCTNSCFFFITVTEITLGTTQTNVLCNGAATGSIDLTVSGGTPAYTYDWSNGATTEDIAGLLAGTYTVIVTDANLCTQTISATITEAAALVLSTTQVDVLCNGAATGSIDLTVMGNTAPYTYAWSNGATTEDISGLVAGVYTVVVTDANLCTQTTSATIAQPSAIVLSQTSTNELCNGGASGAVDLTVSGGVPAYTYAWTNGATTEDLSGLTAGTYTVVVTDANMCTKTTSVTITEPTAIVLGITQVNILCNGSSTGSIDLTVSGGTPGYTYSWTNGATTQDLTGLTAGTYTVVVTDANMCAKTISATITELPAIVLSTTEANATCGSANGSIDLTVSSGTSPYTYAWSNGATTEDISGLAAGTYTVVVTDANMCTKSISATIANANGPMLSTTQVDVLCNGAATGSIDLTVTNGMAPYTYNWTNGATTEDITGLTAGTYTVTVTDANTCSQTTSVTITQPTAIVLTSTQVNVLCNGAATGSIDLMVSGGTPGYTYSWTNGATTQDLSGLIAGTYTVVVTDANLCTKTTSVTITEPTAILLTTTQVNILCNGAATGSIDLTVSGGTPGYTYSWSNGATTEDLSGLIAGTYTVVVTDANMCSKTISATITELPAIMLSTTQVNATCGSANGSIDLTVTGGASPYTYAWSNGATTEDITGLLPGTYTVVVTDVNLCAKTISATITNANAPMLSTTKVDVLCNGAATGAIDLTVTDGMAPYTYSWTNGATTEDLSGLVAGTYTVVVTDANMCTATTSATITEPTAIVLSATQVNVLCNGFATGSIDLTVNGGTPGYTYSWTNGATTQDLSGLTAGTYTVVVTDANMCTKTTSVTITEPTAIMLTTTQVNVLCNGAATGSIDLTVSSGTPGYTYSWTNGATTEDLSGLAVGTYTVVVTDANMCTKTTSVTITAPMAIVLTTTQVNVLCNGGATGSINLTVSGGTPAYTYVWTNGATTEDLSGLAIGTYTVVVTDANLCTKTTSVTITEPTVIVLSTTQVNVLCNGAATGSIDLTVNGGTPGYTYSWTNGATTQDLSGLVAGTYTVVVTDANLCTKTTSVTITEETTNITVTETSGTTNNDGIICAGDQATLTATSGTAYVWSTTETTASIIVSPTMTTTYTVTVSDGSGCTNTASTTITVTPAATVNAGPDQTTCVNTNGLQGIVQVLATIGGSATGGSWSDGGAGGTFSSPNTLATYYTAPLNNVAPITLTFTTTGLCAAVSDQLVITYAALPHLTLTAIAPASGTCGDMVTFTIEATNGFVDMSSLQYSVNWDPAQLMYVSSVATVIGGGAPGIGDFPAYVNNGQLTYAWFDPAGSDGEDLANNSVLLSITMKILTNSGVANLSITGAPTPIEATNAQFCTLMVDVNQATLTVSPIAVTCPGNQAVCLNTPAFALMGGMPAGGTYSGSGVSGGLFNPATAGLGMHTITYTYTNNATTCTNSCTFVITVNALPVVTCPADFTTCINTAPFPLAGGAPAGGDYDGDGVSGNVFSPMVAGPGLHDISYTYTDGNGCTNSCFFFITVTEITLGTTQTDVLCNGAATGSIDLTVSGGTPGYIYNWSNGATTEDIAGLLAGTYTVIVTDANLCTQTISATITEAAVVVLSTTKVDVLCNGTATGSIDLTVTGNTSPYTYAWSNGATTEDISGLAIGTYTVVVTDANMCTKTTSVTITQPSAIALSWISTDVICNGDATGTIDLMVSGGTPGYTYSWTNGATTQDLTGLTAGTYTVVVTDANMCTKSTSATIAEPTAIVISTTQVNVLCNGAVTGSIDLTVSGGTPGYTYSWTNGATTQDLTSLTAGTYTVVVTDANMCTKTTSVTITEPTAIVLTTTQLNVLCNGGATGSIDLTVNGGTPGYTYSWTNGATTQDLSGLVAGTYTVVVTDASMCTKTTSVTITEPTAIVLTTTQVNVMCNGAATGSIDLTVNGGTPGYTYSWTNGATTQDLSGLIAGTYTVVVTDANLCTKTTSVTISQPTAIVLTTTQVNVLCNGAATGSIDLTVSGGTPGYTYSWTNGATTQDLSGLIAGTYTVVVTDANLCTKTTSVTITQPTAIVLTTTQVNVLCNGAATGSIDLTVSGGTPGYTYSWTNGATTQDLSGQTAGTYTVVVTDANMCTKTTSVTINQPTAIVLTTTQTNVLCNGSTMGSIDLTVSGGTPAYTYAWSNGATTEDLSGLVAGTYTVVVTDANMCTKTTSVTITQISTIVLSTTQVNVLCNGAATGTIDLTVSGGTPGYTYSWTNGATTQDLSGLIAGTYTVVVTDANLCTKTTSVTITQPTVIVLTTTQVNVLCNGAATGSIDLTVSGGTPGYTYSWTNGATTQDLSGLTAGTYTVVVTDANLCTKTTSVTITQPTAIVLTTTQVNVLCNGAATGSIDLTVSGGTPGYTYSWTNGATTQDLSGLTAGTYTVVVTDANLCTKTTSVTITQPTAIVLTTTQVNVLCNGAATGSIDLTVNGGTPGYSYSWTNGATTQDLSGLVAGTYTVVVTDANLCTKTTSVTITEPSAIVLTTTQINVLCNGAATGSIDLTVNGGTPGYTYSWSNGATTQDLSGLTAGTYTVVVTDANLCTKTTSVTITQPTAIVLTTTQVNVSCNGSTMGSIDLTVSGGTPGYTYSWSNGATTQDLSGLTAGTYTVVVTDANLCTKTTSVTITQISTIVLTTTQINVLCNGGATGSIDLTVSGGTPGYTYSWTNGATTEDLSGLTAGTYTVVVTDANLCTKTTSVTITQPTAIVLTTTQVNVLCNGAATGSIDLTVSGGTPGYTYSWTNGATTQDLSGLAAGTYTVVVTDANMCTKTTSVTITQPTAILLTTTQVNVLCNGSATGSIDLTVSGGTPGYTYAWTNGATTQDISGLVSGTYTVTVTDANACTKTISATITQPTLLVLTTTTSPACSGINNGAIDLTVSGGTPGYTYAWTNGATTQDLSGLGAGTYTVTVTDANACTKTTSATITNSSPIVLSTTTKPTCAGTSVGMITLTVNGGTPAYTYAWSNGATTQNIMNLAAGTYTVTVTDAIGCSATTSATITANPAPTVNSVANQAVCAGSTTTAITFSGTPAGVVFNWTNNNTSIGLAASGMGNIPAFVGINATNAPVVATITVTPSFTSGGTTCTGTPITFTITVNPVPAIFAVTGGGAVCLTDVTGAPVGLSGSQTNVNYQLLLNGNPVGAPVAGTGAAISFGPQLGAGVYTVKATHSQGGCMSTMTGSATVSTFDCGITITDPCVCKNNATNLINGQFDETIKINAPGTQTWTVTAVTGLYLSSSPAPPAAPSPMPIGTVLTNLGVAMNMFELKGVHVDALGYTVTVSNGAGTSLTIGNSCSYPNPSITSDLSAQFCLFSDPITLVGNPGDANIVSQGFTINGVPATQFNPSQLGIGTYTIVYTVDGGVPKAFGPNDPGCIQSVSTVVHVIATPAVLNCNDHIYVSLPASCTGEIMPDDVLEGTYGCFDDYLVELDRTLPLGNGPWTNGLLSSGDIGKTYQARVTHQVSGNKCWGLVTIEDKLAPAMTCEDIHLICPITTYDPAYLQNVLGINTAYPVITDCSNFTSNFVDTWFDLTCTGSINGQNNISAYVLRKWTATDIWGNSTTCNQYIYFDRRHVSDVLFPADYTIQCGTNLNSDPSVTGAPYVTGFGRQWPLYPGGGFCEMQAAYVDQILPVCDGTYKILRTWTVLDWCLPTSATPPFNPMYYIQLIKVVDETGPVMVCPANMSVSIDPFQCCATVDMPDMVIEDACSRVNNISGMVVTFDQYTGAQTGMHLFGGTLTDFPGNNWWDRDTMARWGYTPCLPIGTHTVTYMAQDDCSNVSTCTFRLTVADYVPPVAACDQTTVVGIGYDDPHDCYTPADGCTGAGVTWVKAKTFDDGSSDDCHQVKLTVRRMSPYSDCINNLDHNSCYANGASEFDIATAELDSIKFYCCEVGTTQTVILRVYQVDVNGNITNGPDGSPIFNECMIQVEVQDKVKPICQSPSNVTVTCEQFDPSLWLYGKPSILDNCCLDLTKVYQGQCGLTHSVSYTQFDTLCNKGTITRTFRAFDCHNNSSQCTQRVVVTYEQDYYVRFPNDVIVTICDGTGAYGEPTFFGKDCELLGVTYQDQIFTVVPDACFKIERNWKIINWCTYDPNLGCVNVPNPNPNAITNHPTNLPGPIVSPIQTVGDPWKSTIVKISPNDALATNYSIYYNPNANCYTYKQIIKIIDTHAPTTECPASPVTICDLTANDPQLWNQSYWWDNWNQSHDLCEAPSDICLTATDACSGSNINIEYQLFLDLDGDGVMETVVNSTQLGNQPGGLGWNNILFGNFTGAGVPRQFDGRPVPTNQKWGFAIQETITGNKKMACVKFNTFQAQNTFVTPQLPHGTHKIKWFVSDGCGNESVCEYTIIIKDCKAPTVVCLNGLSVNIMPTGMIQLWASDFLQYAEDNCTLNPYLKYGIRKCGTGTGFPVDGNGNPITNVIFDCTEVGTQCVELWAIDHAGNADYCETYVIVQDNQGICAPSDYVNVSGVLKTEIAEGVENALVEVTGSVGAGAPFTFTDMSDSTGFYAVNGSVPLGADITITPIKDENPLNGVTTYDLVLISKHILGIEPLGSPYKMIAADANKSNSITTFDIVELRKLILGIYQELPSNTSWRFVEKDFVFPNQSNPFQSPFPENISVAQALWHQVGKDFVGVKIGDVNNTVVANNLMASDDRTVGTLLFDLNDRNVKAGEEFEVTFNAADKTQGFQMTLNLNGLQVSEIVVNDKVTANNFGVFNDALTVSVDGADAFTVKFRATKSGKLSEMVAVSSRITKAEAYGMRSSEFGVRNTERLDVALRFDGKTITGVGFELYQNQPNPFVNKTFVGFHLPDAATATLTVYDETGRVVFTQKGDFAKGYNAIMLDRALLNTTGILYYTLETATDAATKKMIQAR